MDGMLSDIFRILSKFINFWMAKMYENNERSMEM